MWEHSRKEMLLSQMNFNVDSRMANIWWEFVSKGKQPPSNMLIQQ